MRILFVVPYTPTLIRTRPYNLLCGLARRGHNVTLATLWENAPEHAALEQFDKDGIRVISARLTKACSLWNTLRALPTNAPLQSVYCWQPQLAEILTSNFQRQTSNYDIVHVEHLRGARYGLFLQSAIRNSHSATPIVWDSVDCISYLFEQAARSSRSPFGRFIARFELARTRRYEAWLVNQFDRVLVTSPVDAAALEELASRILHHAPRSTGLQSAITILPNGVDLDYFTPAAAPREPATIVFTGKMSYHANVTAALHLVNDIMPLVWARRPDVRVWIVGKDPSSPIRNLATRHSPRVTVTGTVPDIRPYLQRATVAVAPISYGAGIQNKVLEAMACATPVVATPQAVSALQATDGEHLLVADRVESFAFQVLRLVDESELRTRVGMAGRRYVEAQHAWDGIVARLEEIYFDCLGSTDSQKGKII